MKWDYVATGLTLAAIGLALLLTLPPSGWPKMPPALVHIGIIFGAVLLLFGLIVTIVGVWPVLPIPKFAVLGMGFAVLAFIGFGIWFWIIPDVVAMGEPLRRLIAYNPALIVPWTGGAPQFHGFNLRINNVSDETIETRIELLKVDVDGTVVLQGSSALKPVIVPQTQGSTFQFFLKEDATISKEVRAFTVEFEVHYDTIPASGIRKSYKKLEYPLNWANGKDSPPLLEPQTLDEWER